MRVSSVAVLSTIFLIAPRLAVCAEPACNSSAHNLHFISDPVLKRRWQVLSDCRHPNWPPLAMEISQGFEQWREEARSGIDMSSLPAHPVVLVTIPAGSRVDLWSETPAHIHLSGTALEKAELGQTMRVRVGISGKVLTGTVSGPGAVELNFEPSTRRQP